MLGEVSDQGENGTESSEERAADPVVRSCHWLRVVECDAERFDCSDVRIDSSHSGRGESSTRD